MNATFERHNFFPLSCQNVQGLLGYVPRFHIHVELLYVLEGCVSLTVDGVAHTLKAGEIAILFPYLTHSYESAPEAKAILMMFDPSITSFESTLMKYKPTCFYREDSSLRPLLERAVIVYQQRQYKTASGYLNAALGELLELLELEERDSADRNVVVRLLSYCEENFTQPITVASVAQALYISPSYVSKIFSQKLRYSFREYINALRIQKAKFLLRETDKQMLQIMAECGFRNQSSFNRVFRENGGISPKAYRAAMGNKRNAAEKNKRRKGSKKEEA